MRAILVAAAIAVATAAPAHAEQSRTGAIDTTPIPQHIVKTIPYGPDGEEAPTIRDAPAWLTAKPKQRRQ